MKILMTFFSEIEKFIPKFTWNLKVSGIAKSILKKKNKVGDPYFLISIKPVNERKLPFVEIISINNEIIYIISLMCGI